LNTHTSAVMRAFIGAHSWLTVFQLPSYAPELNPAEGKWSAIKGSLGTFTTRTIDHGPVVVAV
jgi:transposase